MHASTTTKNLVLIICGPAGSGKTTLCDNLRAEFPSTLSRLVTTTSRAPRPGEIDGVDYHFLSSEVFEIRINEGAFIEWAKVHGRFYGSQKRHLEKLLQSGADILLNIDVQGAETLYQESLTNPILKRRLHRIFIKPLSMEQLIDRLQGRGADDEEEIKRRLHSAEEELRVANQFDHIIISGSKEEDYCALKSLYLHLKKTA
jgi:guanylate kinase